jgi:hypothetical protein
VGDWYRLDSQIQILLAKYPHLTPL